MREIMVAAVIVLVLFVIMVTVVAIAYEERRETMFEVGPPPALRRAQPPSGSSPCPDPPRGTPCPIWDRRGGGQPWFPPRAEPPPVIHRVEPVYPEAAGKPWITGIVILEVGIRRDGSVGGVCVLKPLPCGLDAAAEAAVKQWKFEPVLIDGEPADVVSRIVVPFNAP